MRTRGCSPATAATSTTSATTPSPPPSSAARTPTPGFLTTVTAYLREHPTPTAEEAREAISGNLCRCTGYVNIVAAVRRAAELMDPSA